MMRQLTGLIWKFKLLTFSVAVALLYKFRGENFVVALAWTSNTLAQYLSFHSQSQVDEKKKEWMQAVEAFRLSIFRPLSVKFQLASHVKTKRVPGKFRRQRTGCEWCNPRLCCLCELRCQITMSRFRSCNLPLLDGRERFARTSCPSLPLLACSSLADSPMFSEQ